MAFREHDAVFHHEYVGDDLGDAAPTVQRDLIADADRRELDVGICTERTRFTRSRNLYTLFAGQCILFLSGI